jgi:hypothetical protein
MIPEFPSEQLLLLKNLNERPYIHGTSIVKGVLESIQGSANAVVTDFEIRLRKKLISNPMLYISPAGESLGDVYDYEAHWAVVGAFLCLGQVFEFHLVNTNSPCTDVLSVDEKALSSRVHEDGNYWKIRTTLEDDIHVCLNEVSKVSNQLLFAEQLGLEMTPDKQTWFVGYRLPTLHFLSSVAYEVGVSKAYRMLTQNKMLRKVLVNGKVVGDRVCVYA